MPFDSRLRSILQRDTLDADHALLLLSVEELNGLMYRCIRLAAWQHEQLGRLADLVPKKHAAEAATIVASSDERGDAVAAEYAEWAGPDMIRLITEVIEEKLSG